MNKAAVGDFVQICARFQSPIAALNCGDRCAPYNEGGAQFYDTHHAAPAVYLAEWKYLQNNTDLWRLWEGGAPAETEKLRLLAPEDQALVACKGHRLCQREYRSLTCRAFPFFPYITLQGEFLGLSYYWEYLDRCWVINHLQVVTRKYLDEFVQTHDGLFARMPEEKETFRQFSSLMRRVFGRRHHAIPMLHRNGGFYKISPRNGRARRAAPEKLRKYGPYKIAAQLPFPDEIE